MLNIVPSYATLKLYTSDDVLEAYSYHIKCKKCKLVYYHGFNEDKKTGERVLNIDNLKVIIFNSGIAYENTLLKKVDSSYVLVEYQLKKHLKSIVLTLRNKLFKLIQIDWNPLAYCYCF